MKVDPSVDMLQIAESEGLRKHGERVGRYFSVKKASKASGDFLLLLSCDVKPGS